MEQKYSLMAKFLNSALERMKMTANELGQELGYRAPGTARLWLEGQYLPPITGLHRLAQVLDVDVRALSVGWQIETEPALGVALRTLLTAVGLSFPVWGDETAVIAARKPDQGP